MISAKTALNHLDVRTSSAIALVQDIGNMIRESANPIGKAHQLIETITGLNRSYDDLHLAMTVAQHCAEVALKSDTFDPETEIVNGERRDEVLRKRQPWLFARAESTTVQGEQATVCEGIDVKVTVKSDGTIKKGGKQVLAAELYKKHVLESATPVDNQGMIAILMKELGMSKAGATTYQYNLKKQFGGTITPKGKE